MKVSVYNKQGKTIGTTLLPKEIFEVEINSDLVHQVIVSQMANRRKKIAHTKERAAVRGGGKKPWKQKGTGRARVGSIRSPLWKGGGVTFGPTKEKVFKKKIPKSMRRLALFMALSAKAKEKLLVLLDELKIAKPKTKEILEILKNFPCREENTLLILPKYDKDIIMAARNIPKTFTIQAKELNCLDLLSFKYLLFPKESIKIIKETFLR